MAEIKLYKSSWKAVRLIALTLPFVIIGIWMISKEQKGTFDYIMGWVCTCFFGMGIPIGIYVLFDQRPQIIISETGVWDRTMKQVEIKWEQIIKTYPTEIHNQKFIAIAVNETFEFKKKQYKWVKLLNDLNNYQRLNLNISQIKIDETKLSELLNKLIHADKNERPNHIRAFSSNQKLKPNFDFQNYLVHFFILIGLIILTLNYKIAFMPIIILTGISTVIVKWYNGTNNNSLLNKYAKKMVYLGFANFFLSFTLMQLYDFTSNKVGIEITYEIKKYKSNFGKYPNDIKTIRENLNLNPIQDYIADKIEYKNNGIEYKLILDSFNHTPKEFDTEQNKWN